MINEIIKIKRIEEKTAIIFQFLKRKNCLKIGAFLNRWYLKWREDFDLENGKRASVHNGVVDNAQLNDNFDQIYKYYCKMWGNKSIEELTEILKETRTCENMPIQIFKIAKAQGYNVWKAHSHSTQGKNNGKLSGFCITKQNGGKPVAGKHFDLTLDEVKEFLKIKKNYVYNNIVEKSKESV